MSVASRVGMLAVRSWRFQSVKSDISGGLGAVFSFQCQVFSKNLDGDGMGILGWMDGNRGVHGVTRPTTRGLARRWMIVSGFTAGRKSCAGLERCRAIKCLLRRQTESQRDFVHHRRVARGGGRGVSHRTRGAGAPRERSAFIAPGISRGRRGNDWRRWDRSGDGKSRRCAGPPPRPTQTDPPCWSHW